MGAHARFPSALGAGLRSRGSGLWAVQALLAAFYGLAGFNKVSLAPDVLVQMGLGFVASVPLALVRFIGVAEIAGALGMILPMATRILPGLTPLAALGLCAIQILAMPLHIYRGEYGILPVNLVLLAMALLVFRGRRASLGRAGRPAPGRAQG